MDTPETQVNEVLAQMDKEGFTGEGIDPMVLYAANAEKRRRDTQGSYTKSQQELKRLAAVNDQLAVTFEAELVQTLPIKAAAELEELKHTDPEAWRAKLGELESARRAAVQEQLKTIANQASAKTELELRSEQLESFKTAYPDLNLTDEVIENDIPPRITRKLEQGKISFADYLEECRVYLGKGKTIDKGEAPPTMVDLGSAAGSAKPGGTASTSSSYTDEIY